MNVGLEHFTLSGSQATNRILGQSDLPSSAEKASNQRSNWVTPEKGVDDLVAIGGEIRVEDEMLRKDDSLGRLVDSAFGF